MSILPVAEPPAPVEPPSLVALYAGLLAGEVLFGLAFWLSWLVLFLALNAGGVAVTAILTAAFAVECERAALRLTAGWTPDRLRLALSGVPVVLAVAVAHNALGGWEPMQWLFLAVAVAFVLQAFILRYLTAVPGV
ncbi:hypothetical protein [Conexibacter woesei]|uniref:hypothetical protein n=1 Tax=Conexibacter woesei TaxID=191495 RepID=UPI0004167286|nr:hypothetical protein [Conexibacter woesei]